MTGESTPVMAFQLLDVHVPSVIGDKGRKTHPDGQKKSYEYIDHGERIFFYHFRQWEIPERSYNP